MIEDERIEPDGLPTPPKTSDLCFAEMPGYQYVREDLKSYCIRKKGHSGRHSDDYHRLYGSARR